MIKRRQKESKIIKIILFWIPFIIYVNLIPPFSTVSFLGFYLLFSTALFYTVSSFSSIGRTIFLSVTILAYLMLRQFHLDNILNTIILIGIFVTLEIYFRKS